MKTAVETLLHPTDDTNIIGQDISWLSTLRQQALDDFSVSGLPGIRDEQWRYTNLRTLKSNVYTLATANKDQTFNKNQTLPSEMAKALEQSDNERLVFINGSIADKYTNIDSLDRAVTFTSLSSVLQNSPDLLETHFGSSLPKEKHGFTSLNTAYCQDGYVLSIPKNCVLENTLEVLFINTSNDKPQATHSRNFIVAGRHSQCQIVERHIGSDGSVYLNNTITEIIANENSHVDHYKVQQESNDAFHIGGVFVEQFANSNVKNHNLSLKSLVTRNDIHATLNAAGAHIEMNGLVMGAGRQHIDNHTQVNHVAPNCTSDEYYKTILNDKARSVFRGRIIVAEDAQLTNADQQNNNLLLSNHAEADSLPQLEIYADDVKCSHGATVGQLDSKSLFYLRSRGINLESATALLTFAFANEVIERINVPAVRDELTELLAGQLLNDSTSY